MAVSVLLDKWCNQFKSNADSNEPYRKRYASHFTKKHLINYNAAIKRAAFNKVIRKPNDTYSMRFLPFHLLSLSLSLFVIVSIVHANDVVAMYRA